MEHPSDRLLQTFGSKMFLEFLGPVDSDDVADAVESLLWFFMYDR